MTRTAAREIAIQLSFAANASGRDPGELLNEFFSEEHYQTLSEEESIFAERPDEKQLSYIKRILNLTRENLPEIDGNSPQRG